MKVKELVVCLKNKNFVLEKSLDIKEYLPMEMKKKIAESIIFECTDVADGRVRVDSVQRYMCYVRNMIIYHTNLDYKDEDYDILCSTAYNDMNLLNYIMSLFPEDAKECSRILDLMTDDYMQDYTMENQVGAFLNEVEVTLKGFVTTITNKVSDLKLDDVFPDQIKNVEIGEILKNVKLQE